MCQRTWNSKSPHSYTGRKVTPNRRQGWREGEPRLSRVGSSGKPTVEDAECVWGRDTAVTVDPGYLSTGIQGTGKILCPLESTEEHHGRDAHGRKNPYRLWSTATSIQYGRGNYGS